MKNFKLKKIDFSKINLNTNLNLNLGKIILFGMIILILLGGGFTLHTKQVNNLKTDLEMEVKLKNALLDTITTYVNKNNELVAEKLTIQANVKELEKNNANLTIKQKELIKRVKDVEKENEIITAALVESNFIIDSLMHEGQTVVDDTKKTITFTDNYDKTIDNIKYKLDYNITIGNVVPFNTGMPTTLSFNSLKFPNEQFIEFHWKDERKDKYPIAFSVTNSNGFYQTTNINSYAIPELIKSEIKPTGWQKFGSFFTENGKKFMYIGIGGVLGVGTYVVLTQ